jgi:hypothetical protein
MAERLKTATKALVALVRDVADTIIKGIPLTTGDVDTLRSVADAAEIELESKDTV